MAAFGTKKLFGDRGLQMTFPLNATRTRVEMGMQDAYFPSDFGEPMDIMMGDDFQSRFHQEKRAEAHQSVRNGIQNKRSAERLLLTGIHNYHVPKPVLGQRKFANPSLGALSFSSARQDQMDAPWVLEGGYSEGYDEGYAGGMRGGVVTTSEGQTFYRKQLNDRINQLDAINAVAVGYAVPAGQPYETSDSTKVGQPSKINFFFYLRALGDSILTGDLSRFTFENLKELVSMMISFGPTADEEDFNDMIDGLDESLESVRDGLSQAPDAAEPVEKREYGITLQAVLKGMKMYVDEMFRNMYLSTKDREALSKSLIKTLKFSRFLSKATAEQFVARDNELTARERQEVENLPDEANERFNRPAVAREDAEQGFTQRQPFAGNGGDPNRERYGNKSGKAVQTQTGWFGEAEREDANPGIVAPLNYAGADPNAGAAQPLPDVDVLRDALEEVATNIIESLLTPEDADRSLPEQILAHYPDTYIFVSEVVREMQSRGFTQPMIAAAAAASDLNDIFSAFIASNSGSLRPLPPSRFPNPTPNTLTAPLYQPPTAAPAPNAGTSGLPQSREEFASRTSTRSGSIALGKMFVPPYVPRQETTLRNMRSALLARMKIVVPGF